MNESQKLPGVEFFRFYFILWICLFHIWTPFDTPHANFAVEFFFILSGYFLYRSFSRKKADIVPYIASRWKRLYPVFLVALIPAVIINIVIAHSENCLNITTILTDFIAQASLLFETGLFHSPTLVVNATTPLWYVGVLFIASIILYASLHFNKDFSLKLAFPLFSIGFLTFIFTKGLHLTDQFGLETIEGLPFLLPALGRGLAEMCIGILIAAILEKGCLHSEKSLLALNILSVVAVILLTVYAFFIDEFYEEAMLVMMTLLVATLTIPSSWFNRLFEGKIWIHLGSITYEMLCLHMISRYIINGLYTHFPVHRNLWIVAYILLTILMAEFVHWGLGLLSKRFAK